MGAVPWKNSRRESNHFLGQRTYVGAGSVLSAVRLHAEGFQEIRCFGSPNQRRVPLCANGNWFEIQPRASSAEMGCVTVGV